MKKTLFTGAFFAFSAVSFAVSEPLLSLSSSDILSSDGTASLTDFTFTNFGVTVSANLHVGALADLLNKADTGSIDKQGILGVTKSNATNTYTLGLNTNGYSNSKQAGIWAGYTGSSSPVTEGAYCLSTNGNQSAKTDATLNAMGVTLNSVDWDNVSAAGISMKTGNNALAACLTLKMNDDTVQQYFGWASGLNFSSTTPIAITFNKDLVESAYVYNGMLSDADTKLVSKNAAQQIVPEPATATLSLLALAGLAARRRRH